MASIPEEREADDSRSLDYSDAQKKLGTSYGIQQAAGATLDII